MSDDLRNNTTDDHKLWQPWHTVKGKNFYHRMAGSQMCGENGSSRCYTAVGLARFQASAVTLIISAFVLKFTQRRILVSYRRYGTTCRSYLLGPSLGQLYPWRWDRKDVLKRQLQITILGCVNSTVSFALTRTEPSGITVAVNVTCVSRISVHHKSIIYNKPTRCNSSSIVFINNYRYALHVPDALCVHHQEHYKL